MKYYRANSEPLLPLSEESIKAGELVYNELGTCMKKVHIEGNMYFVEVSESVLNEGERVSDLTELQLGLFWKLSRNKLKKDENTD